MLHFVVIGAIILVVSLVGYHYMSQYSLGASQPALPNSGSPLEAEMWDGTDCLAPIPNALDPMAPVVQLFAALQKYRVEAGRRQTQSLIQPYLPQHVGTIMVQISQSARQPGSPWAPIRSVPTWDEQAELAHEGVFADAGVIPAALQAMAKAHLPVAPPLMKCSDTLESVAARMPFQTPAQLDELYGRANLNLARL